MGNQAMELTVIIVVLVVVAVVVFIAGYFIGKNNERNNEAESRQDFQTRSRSVMKGKISEQLAPFLPDFPVDLKASEAKFIGQPIDFLIFKGMDDQNIAEVVFVEIKSGNSQLNPIQRKVRDAINEKRVRWHEYRVEDVTTQISD
jgi:predicted Holliday junction resolvase-like endonuclease